MPNSEIASPFDLPRRSVALVLAGGRGSRLKDLNQQIVDRGCYIPDGRVIGEDPAQDARRFHRSEQGVTLVTRAMLQALVR